MYFCVTLDLSLSTCMCTLGNTASPLLPYIILFLFGLFLCWV